MPMGEVMNINTKIIVVLFCIYNIAGSVSATNSISIEDYIPENFTDLMWRVEGGINGYSNNSNQSVQESITDSYYSNSKNNLFRLNVSTEFDFTKIRLQTQLQFNLSAVSEFTSRTYKDYSKRTKEFPNNRTDINSYNSSENNFRMTLNPRVDYKKYIANEKFYNIKLYTAYNYRKVLNNNGNRDSYYSYIFSDSGAVSFEHSKSDQERNEHYFSSSFALMIGDGRLEVGRYTFLAFNIIEELRNNKFLLNEPDKKTMIAFADVLYQNENKHSVDTRLKEIEKYQEVFTFLENHKLVDSSHSLSLLYIQDAYKIYPHEQRPFGFIKEVGLGVEFNYERYNGYDNVKSSRLVYQFQNDTPEILDTVINGYGFSKNGLSRKSEYLYKYIIAQVNYYKPLSMKWQIDSRISGRYYFDSYLRPSYRELERIKKRYDVNLTSSVKYYYTSRTLWSASLSYQYVRDNYGDYNQDYNIVFNNIKQWKLDLGTSLEYRLNLATTIFGSINYSNSSSDNIDDLYKNYQDGTNFNFSLSISHYIY